jgi:hypothetical protein
MNDMQWRAMHAAELAADRQLARNLVQNTSGMTSQLFSESTRDTLFHESRSDSLKHITLKPIASENTVLGHYYRDNSIKAIDGHSVHWLLKKLGNNE